MGNTATIWTIVWVVTGYLAVPCGVIYAVGMSRGWW